MTGSPQGGDLPTVRPHVVAEIVGALSPRLAKRLDSATTKILAHPRTWSGTELCIAVGEDAELVLRTDDGTVESAAGVICSCLLAPACLHRAAAVSAAPVAEPRALLPDAASPPGTDTPLNTAAAGADSPVAMVEPGSSAGQTGTELTPREVEAAAGLWRAGTAVLAAGTAGSGAILQAELLRAAHAAALAGLYRASSAAVRVASLVRAARDDDPAYRLADLISAMSELLLVTHGITERHDPALRGTARQHYAAAGPLRLHGLFTEPVLTSTHVGAITYLADRNGTLSTIADVLPHQGTPDAGDARAAAGRAIRLGDAALNHLQLSRGGLNVSGATRSPAGRLGSGKAVRAVSASGANWTEAPLAQLWAQPLRDQLRRALAARSLPATERPVGADLVFADLTVLGPADGRLLGQADGVAGPVTLHPGHPDQSLPYTRNLALLAAHPGLRMRTISRLATTGRPTVHLLAAEVGGRRHNVGVETLSASDLAAAEGRPPRVPSAAPDMDDAPVHLLQRRLARAAVSGRSAIRQDSAAPDDAARLRRAALPTAALLLEELRQCATASPRDAFGRTRGDDPARFARAWLAAASYLDAFRAVRCAELWFGPEQGRAGEPLLA